MFGSLRSIKKKDFSQGGNDRIAKINLVVWLLKKNENTLKEKPMTDKNSDSDLDTGTKEIEALYVQSAHGMSYQDGRLTLEGIAPTTILFSDRPDRITGHIPSEEFLDSWGEGDNSFADDPPNGVLSTFTEDEINDVVVVLSEPALYGDQMSYSVDILDGEMPDSGGASSLFIDMIGRPLTPVSVAGVHRRGRGPGIGRGRLLN
jgi:hypothetical protein